MTLAPNTPITQENVALLKAGDWLRMGPDKELAQYFPPFSGKHNLVGPWTYIGPDLGDGWIGWGGGENPDLCDSEVRLRDGFVTQVHSRLRWNHEDSIGDIIAFRPALAKPADGELEPWYGDRDPQEVDQAYGEYDGSSCELCGRERVIIGGATGKRICEKCGHYQGTLAAPSKPNATENAS